MVRLELIEARSTSDARLSRAVEGDSAGHEFSLLFRGPHDVALTQDTYSFEHAALGRFSMFIVPVCPPDNGTCYYEAIFNRLPGPVV